MIVELRPHVGVNIATRRPIDLNQDRIFVDGLHLGYCGRQPDAAINLIYPDVPQDIQDAIRSAVVAKFGGRGEQISLPVEIPTEQEDSDSDDVD